MLNSYADITQRIDEDPTWWDESGVPRFCEPDPDHAANIYAREVAFVEIECQSCRAPFLVCFSWTAMDAAVNETPPLSERAGTLHYGDPPNYGCCPAGPTMNSISKRITQFWAQRDDWVQAGEKWERRTDLEGEIDPPWAETPTDEAQS